MRRACRLTTPGNEHYAMNVLITGGTGFIGSKLCSALADQGHSVTALARTPTDTDDEIELVVGDVTAYESIASAFEGIDCVVNLVALSPLFRPRGGNDTHFDVHLGGTENVIDAASEHDVEKIVQMSALGADPHGPTAYLQAKGDAEVAVESAPIDHVIIRPSIVFGDGGEFIPFTERLMTPYVTGLPGGGRTRFQPIWVEDMAEILVRAVESESLTNDSYEIGGPAVKTLADVTRLIARSQDRTVRIVPIPMALVAVGLSVLGHIPYAPMGPDQAKSLQLDNTTDNGDLAAFDRGKSELLTLEAYLGV